MTRDTVWQDDPPFAVGETQIGPATDEEIAHLEHMIRRYNSKLSVILEVGEFRSLIARIKAEREQTIRELRNNYKCGEEYEAGLWSRRNIEAFFRDQEGKS